MGKGGKMGKMGIMGKGAAGRHRARGSGGLWCLLHSTAGTTYPPSVGGRGAALPLNPHYLHDHRLPQEPTKSQGSKLIPRNWSNFDHIREPWF